MFSNSLQKPDEWKISHAGLLRNLTVILLDTLRLNSIPIPIPIYIQMSPVPPSAATFLIALLAAGSVCAGDAKSPVVQEEKEEKLKSGNQEKEANSGDWCEWLSGDPGLLYEARKKANPWIQEVRIGGRFHYQAGYVSGTDVRGNNFSDTHDEFRRARIGAEIQVLKYFHPEVSVNMVDDNRFRGGGRDLDWGFSDFDTLTLRFDYADVFPTGPFDDIEFTYGRMKLKVGEEDHQSSRRILTLERSALADKVGGEESRPTGFLAEFEKDNFEIMLGIFSGEVDEQGLAGWGAGRAYYTSLSWQTTRNLRLLLDWTQNDAKGGEDAIGYAWAVSLGSHYESGRWGVIGNLLVGDNGGSAHGWVNPRRRGDFHGGILMPWYWISEDKLQLVFQYQYQGAGEAEGVRLGSRYVRASHTPPTVDLDSGYGDSHHAFYLGLNYHLCGHRAKIMAGVTYEEMRGRTGNLDATSYLIGFRTYF